MLKRKSSVVRVYWNSSVGSCVLASCIVPGSSATNVTHQQSTAINVEMSLAIEIGVGWVNA